MRWCATLFCLCLVFAATQSSALMTALTTDEITKSSDIVIRGVVQEVESYWSEDGETIMSKATISVGEVVRGQDVPPQVVVEFPGGEIGDLGYRVSDSVVFQDGEDALLFLRHRGRRSGTAQSGTGAANQFGDQSNLYEMVGKAQGKYTIDHLGIARKRGFSVVGQPGIIDNDIPVQELIRKIKEANK